MEYTRAKWTCYGDHVAKAKGEHNSELKLFITQTFWWSPAVRAIQVPLHLFFTNYGLARRATSGSVLMLDLIVKLAFVMC